MNTNNQEVPVTGYSSDWRETAYVESLFENQNIQKLNQLQQVWQRLTRQILVSFDPKADAQELRDEALANLRELCADPNVRLDAHTGDLADLFESIPGSWADGETARLRTIYETVLYPLIQQNFSPDQRHYLERRLKQLIVLRLLDVPYGIAIPDAAALLDALHQYCNGQGLMLWIEDHARIFLVETSTERYAEWIVHRMKQMISREQREVLISHTLWTSLSRDSECAGQRVRLGKGNLSPSFWISQGALRAGEAVQVQGSGESPWIVVFESPWSADRGWRTWRAIAALPPEVPLSRVCIWEPRAPLSAEQESMIHTIAIARALHYILLQEAGGCSPHRLIPFLVQEHLISGEKTRQDIVTCYQEGRLITDCAIHAPAPVADTLTVTLREGAFAAQPAGKRRETIRVQYASKIPPVQIFALAALTRC